LILKQEAASSDAAGQMSEHERAKDRHPLMFSFADDGCPKQCVVRVGTGLAKEPNYLPRYSQKFALTPGVQALKLSVVHESLPTLYYNIGVEVRAGTGRYKDTQVVLLTPRYVVSNQSSYAISVCHHDLIDGPLSSVTPVDISLVNLKIYADEAFLIQTDYFSLEMHRVSEHVHIASQCSLVWNENYEDCRQMCVRRSDVKHWSCPFRIDRIGSFHITMRDADETPRFVRVEVILNSAVFCVTFTDADYYPPPIRIDNQSDVPVLYQQQSEGPIGQHLRTICKARSHIDYAWDDLYGSRRIVLQVSVNLFTLFTSPGPRKVYENKSHVYDPSLPGIGPQLVYENNVYIQLVSSFNNYNFSSNKKTDEYELVLETMQKGKVMLNKQNRIDANGGNQLWLLCKDGCLENVGMSHRCKTRIFVLEWNKHVAQVLDVLERLGFQLMMTPRSSSRDRFQKWTLSPDGRLWCQGLPDMSVTYRAPDILLAKNHPSDIDVTADSSQVWRIQRQRPGSGTLEVECLHNGPTLVVRITDREDRMRTMSMPSITRLNKPVGLEINVTMRSGIGISLVNGSHEELLYARFGGIVLSARRLDETYQMTGSVDVIQIDNQLLNSDKWQVLYCQPELLVSEDDVSWGNGELPTGVSGTARPALKLEMNCTPMKHYDAFDVSYSCLAFTPEYCFRVKLCDLDVQLDELLLWKLVQFAQASDAASSVQQRTLSLPPNTDLERTDPLRTRRWYFGTLDLEMGQIALSVVTVSKSSLPPECRQLKQQFNMKLVSFENAAVYLPPFRQFHYFETSSFLLESLQKFYFAELQKQTLNIVVTLDAFGNPQGLVTDLKDSFQGLFIEGNLQRFVAGLGYGVSNSISKMFFSFPGIYLNNLQLASSAASGVGALTFDQEHEAKRRHNMIRSHRLVKRGLTGDTDDILSARYRLGCNFVPPTITFWCFSHYPVFSTTTTPLSHLYSGVKGLGVGVLGGMTAIFTNTIAESRKSGIMTLNCVSYIQGALRGITTGAVDTVTKPVQGLFDLVEGTASAMKELAGPATGSGRRLAASGLVFAERCLHRVVLFRKFSWNVLSASRVRPPRLCRNLYHLLPPYSQQLANAQMEMMRINGYSTKERLLDVEVCLEQFKGDGIIRQYVLISTRQCYVCQQVNAEPSNVISRIPYKYLKTVQPRPELENSLASLEVILDTDDRRTRPSHIWCGRFEVARRLAEKVMRAKHEYDHSKRTLTGQDDTG
uniref:Ricin B-type lectin domain-containing protein n=1 Tax=Heligmosomoides polygyrus TaxID=6339 RepID=A0A8L8KNU0_HELPZ